MRNLLFILFLAFSIISCRQSPVYTPIEGWPEDINERIENFLNSTISIKDRKVAVFDCDGTTFGQVPYYLDDEALFRYADEVLKLRNDSLTREKLAILDRMLDNGDNVSKIFVEDRVHFLAGLTVEEIENLGYECYQDLYKGKFYPEMKALIANLIAYGFEVWTVTAAPELLYQKFVSEELGISPVNIVGVKSVVRHGIATREIIPPVPQDDGKAYAIETFIKAKPLIAGGNSRGDMDMLHTSVGLKILVNPDDVTVRGPEDGPMNGHTVKSYWKKEGALIVRCNDVEDPEKYFHTGNWGIGKNKSNPK